MPSGANSWKTPSPRSPMRAGCNAAAWNGSRPSTLRVPLRPASATSSSSTGLKALTEGLRAKSTNTCSAKPSRGPRTTISASPTSRLVASPNSLSAEVLTRYTEEPSATPSASASTVTRNRMGCSRNWASSRSRHRLNEPVEFALSVSSTASIAVTAPVPLRAARGLRAPGCGLRCPPPFLNG